MANENLGPAERIINTLLTSTDHMIHNRPGVVSPDASSAVGARWVPVTYKLEEGKKVVYRKDLVGKKTNLVKIGVLQEDGRVLEGRTNVGRYMKPGFFAETAVWMYKQVAEVWKLDNEFAARWASYAFPEDHKDRKVVLAAFMMVQSRKGDPVLDNGKIAFHDEDYRDVGEAMALSDGTKYMDVKQILRVWDLLSLPEIAAVNRDLGFGKSARHAFYGRLPRVIEKWLAYREENPRLLDGLIKKGFRTSIIRLARLVGYKPISAKFFQKLRWKQDQSKNGHRVFAIGEAVKAAESWAKLTEEQICKRIVQTKMDYKRLVGLLPESIGITRAIMAAAIEAGSLSNKDLIQYTPTLEELGLLQVPAIQGRWQTAIKAAEDQRAANIALRVKSKEVKESLQEAADTAVQKAVEAVIKNVRVYFIVDISGSMDNAIANAKINIAKFLQGVPLDQLHVSVFNTGGREITIKHASAAGVENAFKGITAGGGTDHGSGVLALKGHQPKADEDVIYIFVGDEEQNGNFAQVVRKVGHNPTAFGFIKVRQNPHTAVRQTAAELGIPCFMIDERTFADPYAIPRTLSTLIASTPVGVTQTRVQATPRLSLVETILKTPLLTKPLYAQ